MLVHAILTFSYIVGIVSKLPVSKWVSKLRDVTRFETEQGLCGTSCRRMEAYV